MLEDRTIIKVGIGPFQDEQKLRAKYNVNTRGTWDLRFLAEACGDSESLGLGDLARKHLGMKLDKKNLSFHYHWEDEVLDSTRISYAADDVFASIELFKTFASRKIPGGLRVPMQISSTQLTGRNCLDIKYIRAHYYLHHGNDAIVSVVLFEVVGSFISTIFDGLKCVCRWIFYALIILLLCNILVFLVRDQSKRVN